jgi:hypothetical protein
MTNTLASKTIERWEAMKRTKMPWRPMTRRLSEYVFQRAMNENRRQAGPFLNGYIFDDTAPWAARTGAALLKANMFPSARRAIKIKPHKKLGPKILEKPENKKWFDDFQEEVVSEFAHPRAAFDTAANEFELTCFVFGTAGLGVWEQPDDAETDCYFTSGNINAIFIEEGPDGYVDTIYIAEHKTVKQVVQMYGAENVSRETAAKWEKNDLQHEVLILHAIEPRAVRKWSFGNLDMKFASVHIEVDSKHVLQEGGYESFPMPVGRFYKDVNSGDPYGYSPLMDCMPSILEINHARECMIRAGSKTLRPPLAVTEDGVSTHSKIDLSDGGINVKKLNGRIESANFKWIEPLFTVGDMKPVKERISEIIDQISRNCFLDRLLDFNSDQRMTLGEVNVRERRTGQSMLPVFQQQTAEVWTPVVHRVCQIKWKRHRFGYMPGSIEAAVAEHLYGYAPLIPDDIANAIKNGVDVGLPQAGAIVGTVNAP